MTEHTAMAIYYESSSCERTFLLSAELFTAPVMAVHKIHHNNTEVTLRL